MKVLARVVTLVAAILCTVQGPTPLRAEQRDFWVLNDTGRIFREVYVSPHESHSWENDVLGQASLPSGLGFKVTFGTNYESSCEMDIKVVYSDRSSEIYDRGIDVCNLDAVDLHPGEARFLK
jgi:hypothetical protein